MITVVAGANAGIGGAVASAVDPILDADSVNPDVTIEFPNLADDPNPPPLMGDLTPEVLQASGLDAQPFVDLGFFDTASGNPPASDPPPPPSADSTPPATSASPTPGANAQGWSNVPVTVALGATDNAGGSGVKDFRDGATTVTYFAVDNVGNQEAAKTLTVRIATSPKVAPTATLRPTS